jgi:hypothetical protein
VLVSRRKVKMNARTLVRYYRFTRSSGCKAAFVILICGRGETAEYFVMPFAAFLSWNGTVGHSLYLPERQNTYALNAHLGKTDWIWQYRDAWHLLKGESR